MPTAAFRRAIQIAETPHVFVGAISVLLGAGAANSLLLAPGGAAIGGDASLSSLYTLVQATFYLTTLRLLTHVTPRLVGQIRHAVQIGDEPFARYARWIAGSRTRTLFALLPPALALLWLISVTLRLGGLAEGQARTLESLTYAPLPFFAIFIGSVALWRMVGLAQLARQPLEINLFDASNLAPIGKLSLWYSLLIIGGELLHLALLGAPNLEALAITLFSTVASIAALWLPLWSVHLQMKALKARMLAALSARVGAQMQGLLATDDPDVRRYTDQLQALQGARTIIQSLSSWPITSVVSTARALFVPFVPILYVLAQQLVVPWFKALLQTLGLAVE